MREDQVSPMRMRELMVAAVHDLGSPPEAVVFENGCVTSRGVGWQHLECDYKIEQSEAVLLGLAPLVNLIKKRRWEAYLRLEAETWKRFLACVGEDDPTKWRMVGLEHWWLREEPHARPGGTTVYMTRVYAFDSAEQMKPIIVEAKS